MNVIKQASVGSTKNDNASELKKGETELSEHSQLTAPLNGFQEKVKVKLQHFICVIRPTTNSILL
jgi:hypothetical protein